MLKTFVLCLAVLLAACGAKPSPEPFPAPASTASSEIRRLPHPAVEALDTPSPLFRQAPAEQARAQQWLQQLKTDSAPRARTLSSRFAEAISL